MKIKAVKTRLVRPPKDDLYDVLNSSIKRLKEKSIVVITSKIVSICQGRCVRKDTVQDKDVLIKKEASKYLPRSATPRGWAVLTIKNNLLIASAGIDSRNSGDYYVLWPRNIDATAKNIWQHIKRKFRLRQLGIIIADSHTIPLRRGTIGISLAHYGFVPLRDYRGKKDLFGRRYKIQTLNIVDSISAAAVLVMGEGAERTPLAICRDLENISFSVPRRKKRKYSNLKIPLNQDLYGPILRAIKWKRR